MSSAPIRIEAVASTDWPALEAIYRGARLVVFSWLPRDRILSASLVKDAEGEMIYVARTENGDIAGFVSVWAPDAFVHHLYVDPARRWGGVGTALLAFAAARHPGALRLKCSAQNHEARAFYLRRGWTVIGGGVSDDGDYLLMERSSVESGAAAQ